VALLQDDAPHLVVQSAAREGDHAGSGDHHLRSCRTAELERPGGDLADVGVDGAGVGGLVDELLELLGRDARLGERGAISEEAEERVGARGEEPDERAREPREGEQLPRDPEGVPTLLRRHRAQRGSRPPKAPA
jgi:hypothetical protein